MYCLDTNTIIYIQKDHESVLSKLEKIDELDLCITSITRAELFFGAYKSSRVQKNLAHVHYTCSKMKVFLPNLKSDEIFGKIKASLRKSGRIVEDSDLMIAAIALANDLTLVTHNTKHFQNIPGLKLVDWV